MVAKDPKSRKLGQTDYITITLYDPKQLTLSHSDIYVLRLFYMI